MKKILLLLALPLMVMNLASCNKEEWTDDSPIIQFKDQRFLDALLAYNNVDKNNDGQISEKEASVVEDLYLRGDVRNMDEIKYFTSLIRLYCDENQLTSLDLSNNTALTDLNCYGNPLQKLILYKYHIIEDSYMEGIEETYGDIIEYVE